MNLSINTWSLLLLLITYVIAEENSDYIEKCIDHPEDNGEPLDFQFELEQDDPEFWDFYCDTVDDCPSDWVCDPSFKICYAPSYIPSYFKDLAPANPRKVVDFKQRKVRCSSEASSGCHCLEGYICQNNQCLVKPEFAANGVNASEANAVGGISTVKISQSLLLSNKVCVCFDRKTGDCYDTRCIRGRGRRRDRCFCDYKWYTRKQQREERRRG